MIPLVPVITAAGRTAVLAAHNTGLQATITHLAFGTGAYDPTGNETALHAEVVRVPITGGKRVGAFTIQLSALLDGVAEFWIKECGVILSDGTLLAVFSHPTTPMAFKTNGVPIVMAFSLTMAALPASAITVDAGDVDLSITFAEELAKLAMVDTDTMRHQLVMADQIVELQRQVASLNYRSH